MNALSAIKPFVAAALLSTGLLGGCGNFPFSLPQEKTAVLPAHKGVITFESSDWDGAARRVQYTDNDQRVDFALFRGRGAAGSEAQAEFVYMERPPMAKVSFEFPFTVRDKVETWNFSKDQTVKWQQGKFLRTGLGELFYRPYRLVAKNRQCFGLSGEWDAAVDDPNLNDTRILFGYYCAPPGVLIGEQKLAALITGIGLRTISRRAVIYAPLFYEPMLSETFYRDIDDHAGSAEDNVRALQLAQGQGVSPPAGIAEFPFRYGKIYTVLEGADLY